MSLMEIEDGWTVDGEPAPPVVAGYQLERLLGSGGQAQVWFATDAHGGPVAIKVLPADAPRRELEALRRHRHRHLVGLHSVVTTSDGRPALILDYLAGGSLAQLVAARGPLDPGEVVTIVTPLADLLRELHGAGITHGDVTPGNILFGQDGRPVLCDLGIATVAGIEPRTHGTDGFTVDAGSGPAGDIYGLAACAWLGLTGTVPPSGAVRPPLRATHAELPVALVDVVEESLLADASRRPTAADVARRAFAAVPARPVALVPIDPQTPEVLVVTGRLRRRESHTTLDDLLASGDRASGQGPARSESRSGSSTFDRQRLRRAVPEPRRRPGQRAVIVLAVVLAGVLSGGAAATRFWPASTAATPTQATTASSPTSATAAPTNSAIARATPRADDPLAAVTILSQRRAGALVAGDRNALAAVDVPGSPALAADLRLLEELERRSVRLSGLAFEVTESTLVHDGGDRATVQVTTRTSAHDVRGVDGAVITHVPSGAPQQVTLKLWRGQSGWRVHEVVPA